MNEEEKDEQRAMRVNQQELEKIRNFSKKVNQDPTFSKTFADRLKKKFKINIAFISLTTVIALATTPVLQNNLSNNGINLVQTAYAEQTIQNPVLEEGETTAENDIIKVGDSVYSTAFDAVKGLNRLQASEWFNDTPVDVYNTDQKTYMNLNAQELNDMDLLSNLAQDPNNVMLFGKSINEPAGFVPLNEVIDKLIQNHEIKINEAINSENIYLDNDGQLILIVDLENTDINELVESLKQSYDENTVNNALIYDLNQISERLNYTDEVALDDTGWTASKNNDGSLQFNKKEKELVNEISNIQPINNNEYIVQPNAQGGYDLLLGGVGLSGTECTDLINELKENGIIPQDAEVTPYINGSNNMPEINENAQRFTDERLENNYEMAHDPNAETSLTHLDNNEYIVQPNAQGGYDLLLGGVGLSGTECTDLINELKENGIIPQDAEVTPYINGSNNMPEINENAQRFTDERLENNYEMAHDPTTEQELNPTAEGHYKTR